MLHPDPIAELCLSHLDREEHALQQARAGLTELHDAIVHGDFHRFQTALRRADELAERAHQITQARQCFCRAIADALDLSPESITLTAIANRLPLAASDRVAAARDRLQGLTAELQRQTERTASIVGYCRTFLRKLFADLTDSGAASTSYSPVIRTSAATGSLFVARG